MCGIAANYGDVDRAAGERMLERLAHRGPDDTGSVTVSDRAWLGHTRLSIVDVATLFGDVSSMLLHLGLGRCDAIVYDLPALATLKARAPQRYGDVVGLIRTSERYGAALREGQRARRAGERRSDRDASGRDDLAAGEAVARAEPLERQDVPDRLLRTTRANPIVSVPPGASSRPRAASIHARTSSASPSSGCSRAQRSPLEMSVHS